MLSPFVVYILSVIVLIAVVFLILVAVPLLVLLVPVLLIPVLLISRDILKKVIAELRILSPIEVLLTVLLIVLAVAIFTHMPTLLYELLSEMASLTRCMMSRTEKNNRMIEMSCRAVCFSLCRETYNKLTDQRKQGRK